MDISKLIRPEIIGYHTREYAKEHTKDIKADLSLNINPFGVSQKVIDRIKKMNAKDISHYHTESKELIQEISKYLDVKEEEIMLGDGCDGCLQMIANTFIDKGDCAIIPIPTFHRYEFHTKMMGGKPVFVPMKDFKLDTQKIIERDNPKNKILFLCNPNNPTGMPIDKKLKEDLIKNFRGVVVIDEALADASGVNGTSLIKSYDNLIIVRSFSKTFGLASMRIGYIISNKKIIEQIKKTSSPFKVNGVAQELALEALRDPNHIKESIEYIKRGIDFLTNNLKKMGFKFTETSTTNFLLDISPIAKNSTEATKLLLNREIMVTDAEIFRVPTNKYVRISVGTEEENILFIKTIEEIQRGV